MKTTHQATFKGWIDLMRYATDMTEACKHLNEILK